MGLKKRNCNISHGEGGLYSSEFLLLASMAAMIKPAKKPMNRPIAKVIISSSLERMPTNVTYRCKNWNIQGPIVHI